MKIPLMDLHRQYQSIKPEINNAIQSVLDSCNFVGGPEKENFEKEFAEALRSKFCVGVANGTDAISICLKTLGVGPGDEVVTAANSFIASSEAITSIGARVRFLDVDEKTFHINLNHLEDLLKKEGPQAGGKIKAVIPVHLYGRIVNMEGLMSLARRYQVKVIEDTAQAHLAELAGRTAGTWGDMSTFSFYPGKNLGAYGDAGAILTQDESLAKLARKIANHGRTQKYDHDMEGFNSRLDSLQAAVLRVKLRKLPAWTQKRCDVALWYDSHLKSLDLIRPEIPPEKQHVFHLYVVRVHNRDAIFQKMKNAGIEVGIHYPIILPALEAYKYLGHKPQQDFPVAYRLQSEILSLPLFPEISEQELQIVTETLQKSL